MGDRAYYPCRGQRRSVVYGPEYYAGECRHDVQKFSGGFPSLTPTNYRDRRPWNPCDDIDQLAREVGQRFTSVHNQPSLPVCNYTTTTPSNSVLVSMLRPATHSVGAAPAPGEGQQDDDEDPNNSEYTSSDEDEDDDDDDDDDGEKDQDSSRPDPKVDFFEPIANRLSNVRSGGMKTGRASAAARGNRRPVLRNRRVPA